MSIRASSSSHQATPAKSECCERRQAERGDECDEAAEQLGEQRLPADRSAAMAAAAALAAATPRPAPSRAAPSAVPQAGQRERPRRKRRSRVGQRDAIAPRKEPSATPTSPTSPTCRTAAVASNPRPRRLEGDAVPRRPGRRNGQIAGYRPRHRQRCLVQREADGLGRRRRGCLAAGGERPRVGRRRRGLLRRIGKLARRHRLWVNGPARSLSAGGSAERICARSSSLMMRASSELRMTRGVMKTISSVRTLWLLVLRKRLPSTGMSPRSGTLSVEFVELSWIRPPSTTVWPLVTLTLLEIRRWVIVGFSSTTLGVPGRGSPPARSPA